MLKSLLVLGRVSNLPTVWSNCLAGWFLGAAPFDSKLAWLLFGATFLYLLGMYLNDAVDAAFDRQYRRERPIPGGVLSRKTVFVYCGFWLFLGLGCVSFLGGTAMAFGLLLTGNIVLYDLLHKHISWSPVLMAGCRFFLILMATVSSGNELTGYAMWVAVALGCYIIGLSYVARRESLSGLLHAWPCLLLLVPVLLAYFRYDPALRWPSTILSGILIAWIAWSLRHAFWKEQRNVGGTVSGLLAGIVLVDALSAFAFHPHLIFYFVVLFMGALVLQKYIPAT